jgi:hypothetical protein
VGTGPAPAASREWFQPTPTPPAEASEPVTEALEPPERPGGEADGDTPADPRAPGSEDKQEVPVGAAPASRDAGEGDPDDAQD